MQKIKQNEMKIDFWSEDLMNKGEVFIRVNPVEGGRSLLDLIIKIEDTTYRMPVGLITIDEISDFLKEQIDIINFKRENNASN